MIKTFITKTTADNTLAFWLRERLERENLGLDVFVWEDEMRCGDKAQAMIDEVKRTVIYIPILSDAALEKEFVINEIRAALATDTVQIFPVKAGLTDDTLVPQGLRIEFETTDRVRGRIWEDFSQGSEWDVRYERLRAAIVGRLIELALYYRDEAFYQDAENIDHILTRLTPTASEIKIMVDVYLQKDYFQDYFFRKVEDANWLKYLYYYGFFAGHRNPKPTEVPEQIGYYHVPYWPALHFLQRVAQGVGEHHDDDAAQILMRIVRSVSDYREGSRRIENYHTESAFVEIMAAVPVEHLQNGDIDRVEAYLRSKWRGGGLVAAEIGESLLPSLLRQGATTLAARLLAAVIKCEVSETGDRNEFVPVVDEFWLNDLMEKNKPAMAALFPLQAATIVLEQMEHIVTTDPSQFHVILLPAVEDHPQNRFPAKYQDVLVRAARDFLASAAKTNPHETEHLLTELLGREHAIFARIALHTIAIRWDQYAHLFWPLLGSEMLTKVQLKHELYELLRRNHQAFTFEDLDHILRWIETRQYWTPPGGFVDAAHEKNRRAPQKLEWLTALKGSAYQKVVDSYQAYLEIAGQEPEHPGFSSWMGDVQVGSISPIEVADLLTRDNDEIARYLAEYRDKGDWYGEPSREGLADAFKTAVANDPAKFAADLSPLLALPPYYLYYLLWGLKDGWAARRDFDWKAVLSFCSELMQTEAFWSGPPKKDELYPGPLVSQAADLIQAGTQEDSHAFDQSLLPTAESLLIRLLADAPSEMYEGYDLVTAVLNSPKGRAFAAAISYSLRYARLRKGEDPVTRWAPAVKEDFTRRLDPSFDPSVEFSVVLGEHLLNLAWLDEEWVTAHLNEVFPKDREQHWRGAMAGHLWVGRTRRDLYILLRANGHYAKALETDFQQPHIRERLIHQLTVAYLWGDEPLDEPDSLFARLVSSWRPEDLSQIVTYLGMQRGALEEEHWTRVLDFWRYLFGHYSQEADLPRDEQDLVANASRLAVYLDSIDSETLEWLRLSARNFRQPHEATFLLEYLDALVESSPREVGLVYLELLGSETYPMFHKDHIVHTVETLYAKGQSELADRICNLYGAKGYDFLEDVYKRNRPADL